jgi:hypothetical protein
LDIAGGNVYGAAPVENSLVVFKKLKFIPTLFTVNGKWK